MADWVPVYRKVFTDPRMAALAAQLGLARDQAIMHCIHLWHAVADQSPAKGEIGDIDDATLELWAEWRGRRGRFATAYRELFQVDGCIRNWERYVGDALEAAERERERKRAWWREHRGKSGNLDAASPSSGGASKRASKRASGGVQDKTDMTIPPKPPNAADGAAGPAGARAAAAGVRGGPPAALSVTLAEIAPMVGLTPPGAPSPEPPPAPDPAPPRDAVTPEKAAEIEARRQSWLAQLRPGSTSEAAHG